MGNVAVRQAFRGFRRFLAKHLAGPLEDSHAAGAEMAAGAELTARAEVLERRLAQVRIAAEIAQIATESLHPEALLTQVSTLIRERFNLFFVGIYLLDEGGRQTVLRARSGEPGRPLPALGLPLPAADDSPAGWAMTHHQPRLSGPGSPSELALPLRARDRVLGVLIVQSTQAGAFDADDLINFQGFADAAAISLENARLIAALKQQAHHEQVINRVAAQAQQAADAETVLLGAERELLQSLAARRVSARLLEENQPSGTAAQPPVQVSSDGEVVSVVVPFLLRDQHAGELSVAIEASRWSPDILTLLQTVAGRLALALDTVRLLESSQRQNRELAILNRIAATITKEYDREALFESIIETMVGLFGATKSALVIPQGNDRLSVATYRGVGPLLVRLINLSGTDTDYWRRARANDLFVAADTREAPIDRRLRMVLLREGVRSIGFIPLHARGQLVGILNLGHTALGGMNPSQATFLRTLADQLAVAIDNASLLAEARRQAEEERILNSLTAQISRSLDLTSVLQTAARQLGQLPGVARAAVHVGPLDLAGEVPGIPGPEVEPQNPAPGG